MKSSESESDISLTDIGYLTPDNNSTVEHKYSDFRIILTNKLNPFNRRNFTEETWKSYDTLDLTIPLYDTISIYRTLSSRFSYLFKLKHNFKEIEIDAPTLEQYYQMMKVLRKDLPRGIKTTNIYDYEPTNKFYMAAYDNFVSKYMSCKTKNKTKTLYWYYHDIETNQNIKIRQIQAKRIYCKLYQYMIVRRPMFYILANQYKNYKGNINILSQYSIEKYNHFESQQDLVNFFKTDEDFTDCYCLMEILINYPNLQNCFWNLNKYFEDKDLVDIFPDTLFDDILTSLSESTSESTNESIKESKRRIFKSKSAKESTSESTDDSSSVSDAEINSIVDSYININNDNDSESIDNISVNEQNT